jgi:hypothetical protein
MKQTNIQRCPYCHSDIADKAGSLLVCDCSAIYHDECAKYAKSCVTCNSRNGWRQALTEEDTLGIPKVLIENAAEQLQDVSWEKTLHALPLAQKIWADPHFEDAYKLAKANSKGKLWVIGGKVYRHLLSLLHNEEFGTDKCDFDFLSEKLTWFRHIPDDLYSEYTVHRAYSSHKVMRNPFKKLKSNLGKSPRFVSKDLTVDIVSLKKARGIVEEGLPRTIDGYFQGVPLDIQACAFDLETETLLTSDAFRKALDNRTVGINNMPQARGTADRRGISVGELLRRKAKSISFKVVKPPKTDKPPKDK